MRRGYFLSMTAAAFAVLLASCTPQVATHGHVPNPDALTQIEPGVHTREDVFRLLGTPTAVGTLDNARWYYLTRVTENIAFYDPELVGQTVFVIEFDTRGVVTDLYDYDAQENDEIDMVDRETPTQGHDMSFFEQLFGDLGRFGREGGVPSGRK
jgi:outer membrane protein assembly factor BamE (lipoprotein component of BamABCDE complex)